MSIYLVCSRKNLKQIPYFLSLLRVCWICFGFSELTDIMATSRSYKRLLYVWEAWHNVSGVPLKEFYPKFVELSNKASRADGKNFTCNTKRVKMQQIPNYFKDNNKQSKAGEMKKKKWNGSFCPVQDLQTLELTGALGMRLRPLSRISRNSTGLLNPFTRTCMPLCGGGSTTSMVLSTSTLKVPSLLTC